MENINVRGVYFGNGRHHTQEYRQINFISYLYILLSVQKNENLLNELSKEKKCLY